MLDKMSGKVDSDVLAEIIRLAEGAMISPLKKKSATVAVIDEKDPSEDQEMAHGGEECENCGKEMSAGEESCPECGHEQSHSEMSAADESAEPSDDDFSDSDLESILEELKRAKGKQ